MFCQKCGKDIDNYVKCGSTITAPATPDHFDSKSGKQFFEFDFKKFYCEKFRHREGLSLYRLKEAGINYKETSGEIIHHFFITEDYLKDGKIIVGPCKEICCPFCGDVKPDKGVCFIATAAYGSHLADQVISFKNFRDQYLQKYNLGRKFIYYYNHFSPTLANVIRNHVLTQKISRLLLYPPLKIVTRILKK